MARIDLGQSPAQFTSRIQQADINIAGQGREDAALGNLGKNLTDLTTKVLQDRKRNTDATAVLNGNARLITSTNAFTEELQKKIDPGAPGYTDMVGKFMQDHIDQDMASMPSEEARQAYLHHSTLFKADQTVSASKFENLAKVNFGKDSISNANAALTKRYQQNPDYTAFAKEGATVDGAIDAAKGTLWNAQDADNIKKEAADSRAVGLMEGLKAQEQWQTGLKILHDKMGPDGKSVKDAMNPNTFAKYQQEFTREFEAKNETNAATVHKVFEDQVASVKEGGKVDAGAIFGALKEAQNNPHFKGKNGVDELARLQDTARSLVNVSNDVEQLNKIPVSQWSTLASNNPKTGWNAAQHHEAAQIFRSTMKIAYDKMTDDPASFALSGSPALGSLEKQQRDGNPESVKAYTDASIARQKYLGIDNPKILPDHMISFIGSQIKTAQTPAAQAQVIQKYQQAYGQYFPKMFSELVAKESKGGAGVDARLAAVGYLNNPDAITKIADNTANSKNIVGNFDRLHTADQAFANKTLDGAVAQATGDIDKILAKAPPGGSSSFLMKSLQYHVGLEARNLMNKDTSLRTKDAVDQAYKSIVDSNFTVAHGGNSTILLPRVAGGERPDQSLIEASMSHYSTPEGLKELGVAVPKSYVAAHGGDKQLGEQAYLEQLSKTSHLVSTNTDGLTLVDGDGQGVPGKDGKPIVKTFRDLQQNVSPAVRKTAEERSAFRPSLGFSF